MTVGAAGLVRDHAAGIRLGLTFTEATTAAIAGPLSDDAELRPALLEMVRTYSSSDAA